MRELSPIYEFILWDNCSNNCNFCWQKSNGKNLSKKDKILSINAISSILNHGFLENGSHILLVGGELFDQSDNDIKDGLFELYKRIRVLMKEEKIGFLYLNTNLMYDIGFLIRVMSLFNDGEMIGRIRFTTSYDEYGRFENDEKRNLFLKNLECVVSENPGLGIVVNSILSTQMCKALKEHGGFRKTVKVPDSVKFNLIPYIGNSSVLMPKRNDVFESLLQEERISRGFLAEYIRNFNLNQRKIVMKYDTNTGEFLNFCSDLADCGHSVNFRKYSMSGSCFICDITELFNGYE